MTLLKYVSAVPSVAVAACLLLVVSLWPGTTPMALAADGDGGTGQLDAVSARLQESVPDLPIDDIAATPVPGIFEVVSDGQIYYVGEQGRYLFEGNLIDLANRENLTSVRQSRIAMDLLADMPESDMLIYEPAAQGEGAEPATAADQDATDAADGSAGARTITVFTDTTCPYCTRLHAEIGSLMDAGIRVRYLLYPRAGLGSDAARELESVWCADNPQEALTTAKEGGKVPEKTCDNPIESHIALAHKVGLRGTPMIILDSGEIIPGYQPASALIKMIEESRPL